MPQKFWLLDQGPMAQNLETVRVLSSSQTGFKGRALSALTKHPVRTDSYVCNLWIGKVGQIKRRMLKAMQITCEVFVYGKRQIGYNKS
jgi:hypothetical protein